MRCAYLSRDDYNNARRRDPKLNPQSVTALIEEQYSGLLALLRRKLRDEQLAQDALNQALVTSLEHVQAGRVADLSMIGGYVFQVAMNQMRNHRRKMEERSERRADPSAIDTLCDPHVSPDMDSEPSLAGGVRSLIDSLPTPRDREIVTRFYLDEDEKDAICRDLGLSPLHFDKVIFRARQRMKVLLEAKGFKRSDFFSVLALCFALVMTIYGSQNPGEMSDSFTTETRWGWADLRETRSEGQPDGTTH